MYETDVTQAEPAGETVLILSDGKAGHLAMTRGVAAAMQRETRIVEVAPPAFWRWLAPRGPAPPDLQAIRRSIGDAWPAYVFAAGRLTIPYLRAIRRAAGERTFTVAFMDPRVPDAADLVWLPEHDARRGDNVITTITSPHRFTPHRLAALRRDMPEAIGALPAPRIAVLLGGPGGGFRFSSPAIGRLAHTLRQFAGFGASFLVTPSRRTPPALLDAVKTATAGAPRLIWDGTGENPYPSFLACADAFLVTADSVNMTGEACATGRPVHVFMPEGGRAKFHGFHRALQETGATRPLPDDLSGLDVWHYEPIDSAGDIAAEIDRHARARLVRA
ncbi:MAG: mitochondrial fission ELM1 family protein [Dichotomicrobium sp.]